MDELLVHLDSRGVKRPFEEVDIEHVSCLAYDDFVVKTSGSVIAEIYLVLGPGQKL